jgi:hypothetical protein
MMAAMRPNDTFRDAIRKKVLQPALITTFS